MGIPTAAQYQAELDRQSGQLSTDWARAALSRIADREPAPVQRWCMLRAWATALFAVESHFPRPELVTGADVFRAFGQRGFRLVRVAYHDLVQDGVFPPITARDRDEVTVPERCQAHLASCEGEWYGPVVRGFYQYMVRERKRILSTGNAAPRRGMEQSTILLNLRSLMGLLACAKGEGARSVAEVHQHHVEGFMVASPGYANLLGRGIRFLNREYRRFRRLQVPRQADKKYRTVPETARLQMLQDCNSEVDDLRSAVVTVLVALYAVRATDLAHLRVTDSDGIHILLPGQSRAHPLTPLAQSLWFRWLEVRNREPQWHRSPYAFPGVHGNQADPTLLASSVPQYGHGCRNVFGSALETMARNGIRNPGVLVDGFGVSIFAARKFADPMKDRQRTEVARMLKSFTEPT